MTDTEFTALVRKHITKIQKSASEATAEESLAQMVAMGAFFNAYMSAAMSDRPNVFATMVVAVQTFIADAIDIHNELVSRETPIARA